MKKGRKLFSLRHTQEKIGETIKIEDQEKREEKIPIQTTTDLNIEAVKNDVPDKIEENQKPTAIYSKK